MQNNLNEQLEWLSKNFDNALYAGFQYAPTASLNFQKPVRFNFDNQKRTNSRNAMVCTLGDVGHMELQQFRNNFDQPEVPIVANEPVIPDSAFLDFDLDALVNAEMNKQSPQSQVTAPSSSSSFRTASELMNIQETKSTDNHNVVPIVVPPIVRSAVSAITSVANLTPVDVVSSSVPKSTPITHTALSVNSVASLQQQMKSVREEIVGLQEELNETMLNEGYYPQHLKDHKNELEDQLEVLAKQLKASQSVAATPHTVKKDNSAAIAEIQQKMKIVTAELSAVQSELNDALINEGYYPKPLREQKSKLEDQLEQLGAELRKEKGVNGGGNTVTAFANPVLINHTTSNTTGSATYHTLNKSVTHQPTVNTSLSYNSNITVQSKSVTYLSPEDSSVHVVTAAPSVASSKSSSSGGVDYSKYGSNFVDISEDLPPSTLRRTVTSSWNETPQAIAKHSNSVYSGQTSATSNPYNSYANAITVGSSEPSYQNHSSNYGSNYNSNYSNNNNYNNSNNNYGNYNSNGYNTNKNTNSSNPYDASITISDEDFNSGKPWMNVNNNNSYNNNNNSNSGNYANRYGENNPKCNCNPPKTSGLFTSTTEKTLGLQFFSCKACNFFQWENEAEANQRQHSFNSAAVQAMGIKNHHIEIHNRFGHHGFRQGQRECVENALQGRDVFCLMPTGGGKSIVYQLPAWCCPGMAVVFSPLLSLIQDQVDAMMAIGIRAVAMGSAQDNSENQAVISELRQLSKTLQEDANSIKLLYITPEKFSKSKQMQNLLEQLGRNSLLSRFVIDEAHCLSQWGHDFRPDYLELKNLRPLCPNVPMMLLTATANQTVVKDCMRIVNMKDPFLHTQSFNRGNLRYFVKEKDSNKDCIDDIAGYVLKRRNETGIIYCFSQKDTENIAEALGKALPAMKHQITFYHASIPNYEKERRQRSWSKGDVKVICATIAFGMGINKPDVRYVIHHSLPKSLTNYYQESGRAGRDGQVADCILYYNFGDRQKIRGLIEKGNEEKERPNPANLKLSLDNLDICVEYCQNTTECRRVLLLKYFGENFNRDGCNKTCDNCTRAGSDYVKPTDVTPHALLIIQILKELANANITTVKLTKMFSGSRDKECAPYREVIDRVMHNAEDDKGPLTILHKDSITKLIQTMMQSDYLTEKRVKSGMFSKEYVIVGAKGYEFLYNRNKFPPITLTLPPKASYSKSTATVTSEETNTKDFTTASGKSVKKKPTKTSEAPVDISKDVEDVEDDWLDTFDNSESVTAKFQSAKTYKPAKEVVAIDDDIDESFTVRDAPKKDKRFKLPTSKTAAATGASKPINDKDVIILSSAEKPAKTPRRKSKETVTSPKAAKSTAKKSSKSANKLICMSPEPGAKSPEDIVYSEEETSRPGKRLIPNNNKNKPSVHEVYSDAIEETDEDEKETLRIFYAHTAAEAAKAKRRTTTPNTKAVRSAFEWDDDEDTSPMKPLKQPTFVDIASSGDESETLSAYTQPLESSSVSSNKLNPTRLSKLPEKQRLEFYSWLEQYRKKWQLYWNYFNNTTIEEITRKVPLTMQELADISGVGETKASMYGEELLATIYAFLERNDLLILFPKAVPPSIPDNAIWKDVFSKEADEMRMMEINVAKGTKTNTYVAATNNIGPTQAQTGVPSTTTQAPSPFDSRQSLGQQSVAAQISTNLNSSFGSTQVNNNAPSSPNKQQNSIRNYYSTQSAANNNNNFNNANSSSPQYNVSPIRGSATKPPPIPQTNNNTIRSSSPYGSTSAVATQLAGIKRPYTSSWQQGVGSSSYGSTTVASNPYSNTNNPYTITGQGGANGRPLTASGVINGGTSDAKKSKTQTVYDFNDANDHNW